MHFVSVHLKIVLCFSSIILIKKISKSILCTSILNSTSVLNIYQFIQAHKWKIHKSVPFKNPLLLMKSLNSPLAHHLPLKRQPFETNRRIVPSITIHHETVIAFTILLLLRLPTYLHGTDRLLALLLCSGGWIDRKGNDWIIVAKVGLLEKKTCQSKNFTEYVW